MSQHEDRHGTGAQQLLAVNQALREDVHRLADRLDKVAGRGDRTRWAVYGVILVILLVGLDLWRTEQVDDKASTLQEYDIRNCEAFNQQRLDTKRAWTELEGLIVALLPEASEGARIQRLRDRVNEAFTLRDCGKVGEGRVVGSVDDDGVTGWRVAVGAGGDDVDGHR